MRSSSPARTPKLQLAAKQPSAGECQITPKKDTLHPRTRENPQKNGKRGTMLIKSNPVPSQTGEQ